MALGASYVGLALLFAAFPTVDDLSSAAIVIVVLFTAFPGTVLLYGGYRLTRADIHAALYERIAGWVLGSIGLMALILFLSQLASEVAGLVPNLLILTALASLAGFGMGLYDAQARTRAREAEQRSRELAYQNNRLEGFAGVLAHELRNPLAIARGYHEQLDPRNEEASREVALAHDRIEEMIDILLIIVRGSATDADDEPIDLAVLADQAWNGIDDGTGSETLEVATNGAIRGDVVHVHHLLVNLFQNSVEHAQADVTVRIGDLEDGFFVEDDGPGIPVERHDEVVEPGVTTSSRGTGLGLMLVTQLASLYDWEWTLTESRDGGTRFEFTGVDLVGDAN
ncbi:sensor histidine kinase [Natronosalvus vescus]|uniref:sensor histidine kinase n=1 Tax=Natronosalvus vescus TaxID=2953881 RepID=UPI0020909193|nr:HAMP domain-containing sensor histidine kinase [Natronosalvus vescus]